MSIQILGARLVAKIAAGEVVERPASVVKELVENSLDAGATQIEVESKGGGINLIRVSDNGTGIPGNEVALAFQRHATSKISQVKDLESINTLGFRGEALPSIATVADVEISTKSASDNAATCLRLSNSTLIEQQKGSRPQGTTITVHHLFRHFPARLKFLKASVTENSHIATVLTQYALAFPRVKFTLSIEGRTALRTPGNGTLRNAVAEVYGFAVASQLLEVNHAENPCSVTGLTSPPALSRSNRNYLSFFVNQRWVKGTLLTRAVEDAYQGSLMVGKHPLSIITISLPPQETDVNVHPTKTEIKFRNNQLIYAAVSRAVKNALSRSPLPDIKKYRSAPQPVPALWKAELPAIQNATGPITYSAPTATASMVKNGTASTLPILRVMGQLSHSYILAEGPDGLYLVDQHAAHERIIFDKIQAQQREQKIEIQGLLEPLPVELNPAQEQAARSRAEILQQYGFDLEHFGERSYLLRAVPAVLTGANLGEALGSLLDSLGNAEDPARRDETMAQSLACHGAVKAGQQLSPEEMRNLIRQLEETSSPRTCPHGRPTMLHMSSRQLEKEFGR